MKITEIIQEGVVKGIQSLYGADIAPDQITLNTTRKEFTGDYTVVVFPFTRLAKKKPDAIGEELGEFLVREVDQIERFNVIKGFLNLVVSDDYWLAFLNQMNQEKDFGRLPATGQRVMVEFASPNTNKPLHLGHIRNILLGWSTSRILEAAGNQFEWADIKQDLKALQEVTVEESGRRLAVRTACLGTCGKIFQAVKVAVPPTIREM